MNTIEEIKARVKRLYDENPTIHINVTSSHPKIAVRGVTAVIKAVYPNMFRIEECESGVPRYHSVQYSDLLVKKVEILELA